LEQPLSEQFSPLGAAAPKWVHLAQAGALSAAPAASEPIGAEEAPSASEPIGAEEADKQASANGAAEPSRTT